MLDPIDFVKQLNEGKLDSRAKTTFSTHPIYQLERTFCVICGHPKGWVSQESSKYIRANSIVLVCEDCEGLFGALPLRKAAIEEVEVAVAK